MKCFNVIIIILLSVLVLLGFTQLLILRDQPPEIAALPASPTFIPSPTQFATSTPDIPATATAFVQATLDALPTQTPTLSGAQGSATAIVAAATETSSAGQTLAAIPTATDTPDIPATATAFVQATLDALPTDTPTLTATASDTPNIQETVEVAAAQTLTALPTDTPSVEETVDIAAAQTVIVVPTNLLTLTPTANVQETRDVAAAQTLTALPSATTTLTATPTETATATATDTPDAAATTTAIAEQTLAALPTETATATVTDTPDAAATTTAIAEQTLAAIPTETATATATDTPTLTLAATLPSGDVEWSYEGDNGPEFWGELSSDYQLCAAGLAQSPIDIVDPQLVSLDDVIFSYENSSLNLVNTGTTVTASYERGSFITVDGNQYELVEFNFHIPSEHTVAGTAFAMEWHLVHQDADGNIAVVAILVEAGDVANPVYDTLLELMPTEVDENNLLLARSFNASEMLPEGVRTYRYQGSLTTPACEEGVLWLVMVEPVTLSSEQIDTFALLYSGNVRPVQPLNDRDVFEDED